MSFFLLPLQICTNLERALNTLWWSTSKGSHTRIHWQNWKKLSAHKKCGGMSFKKLHEFNLAILGKNSWRLLTNGHSLVARIYKVSYYPTIDFLNAKLGNNPSFLWRILLAAQSLLRHGTRWRVGLGHQIKIWTKPWPTMSPRGSIHHNY